MNRSTKKMTSRICSILALNEPSIYLYGSVTMDDFRPGWSDIDILVLTKLPISGEQAEMLVTLRQTLLEEEPENPYYRSFEGGMLPLDAFLSGEPSRVVYWGTSGERITDAYHFDSFSRVELLDDGILLAGEDVRDRLKHPTFADLRADVKRHYDTIRKYAHTTGRSLYSFGWLLDIARGIYTLRTGKVAAKTSAGEWALREGLCPVPKALETALEVRRDPSKFAESEELQVYAENLGDDIQSFADVLERELKETSDKV